MALGDDVLDKGGVLVLLARDGVEAVALNDLVVGEPVVEGLAETGAVLVEVLDGCSVSVKLADSGEGAYS